MSEVKTWIADARRDWEKLAAHDVEPSPTVEDESPRLRRYCTPGFVPRCRNLERLTCCLYDEDAKRWIEPDHRPCKPIVVLVEDVGRRLSTGPLCRDEALILASELLEASRSWPSHSETVIQAVRAEAER